ncbi:MAG: hypothetical protein H0T42_15190, partial [Deltaproteobacteria bacterium]|nr:hypothetical protein [Deltaproteobacteria bacterium]
MLSTVLACGGGSKNGTVASGTGVGGADPTPPLPACTDEGAGRDFAAALALAPGASTGCTGTDPDVFSILAPDHPAGTLFELTLQAKGGDITATIFDADQQELGAATVRQEQEDRVFVVLATNSKMYLRVVGSGAAVLPYGLATKASPLIDEDEPNDTAEQARPLNLDKPRTALLQSAANGTHGSADFYRVLIGRNSTLRVAAEPGTDEVSLSVAILSTTGTRLGEGTSANPGAAVTVEARVKRGDYVVQVIASAEQPTRPFSVGAAGRYLT